MNRKQRAYPLVQTSSECVSHGDAYLCTSWQYHIHLVMLFEIDLPLFTADFAFQEDGLMFEVSRLDQKPFHQSSTVNLKRHNFEGTVDATRRKRRRDR